MDKRNEVRRPDRAGRIAAAVIALTLVMVLCFGIRISSAVRSAPQETSSVSEPLLDENWSEDVNSIMSEAREKTDEALVIIEDARDAAEEASSL